MKRPFRREWLRRRRSRPATEVAGDLADAQGILLAGLARQAVAARVLGGSPPAVSGLPAALAARRGVFVSAEAPRGRLRGCLGTLRPDAPLFGEAIRLAGEVAWADHRFEPLVPDDLAVLAVKVSVLSRIEPLAPASPEDLLGRLLPGRHGVLLELPPKPGRSVYLPEVWARVGGDPEAFLNGLCEKQGAPPGAWRRLPDARVSVFTTRTWSA